MVIIWIVVVFGYLWILQFVYEKYKTFQLFVLLAIFGNLAYDGLKKIIYYDPFYPSDSAKVTKYVVLFTFCLFGSIIPILIGAALVYWDLVHFRFAQVIGTIGFQSLIVMGMIFLDKAESRFKLSNKA